MNDEKTALFAFRGEPICFVHVLLNGLDLHDRGQGGIIILEGESAALVPEMARPGHFLSALYQKAREKGIIHGACRACSAKLKVDQAVQDEGIPLIGEMSGHPSMAEFIENGYRIITF